MVALDTTMMMVENPALIASALPEGVEKHELPLNGNGNEEDEEARPPIVGIIYPPPDIRNIVDKTAGFVARIGIQFEERIRDNEKHNSKFSFLNPNDPYHAYYQYKIVESKDGKVPKKEEAKEISMDVVVVPTPRAVPKEPPPFEFMADMPAISAQDLDILKLTAQFVARNGRQFMTALSQREQRNYQFDFLRPNHSLFNYFTKLVEQYTKVLLPPKNLNERLKRNHKDKYQILERVMQRVEYVAYQEEERKKAEEKEDLERLAYASIDWHDFVIVETVEFTEADETIELPPPMSIMELENMSLAQKKMVSMIVEAQQDEKAAEMDMEMDDDVDMEEDELDSELEPTVVQIKPPDTTAPIKIRKDYVPKTLVEKAQQDVPMQVCPRCGMAIRMDEMDEHVRIELLDPKWKEQKQAAEAKKKETNLLQEGTDVARNLSNLSGYRSDIFGPEETEIGRKIGEEEEKKKRIEKEKVVWDGHTASINMATQRAAAGVSIEEQIAAIHRSKGLTNDSESGIGPKIPQQPSSQDQQYSQPPQVAAYAAFSSQIPPPVVPSAPLATSYAPYAPNAPPPFSHQLQSYNMQSGSVPPAMPLQARPPVPPVPQPLQRPAPPPSLPAKPPIPMGLARPLDGDETAPGLEPESKRQRMDSVPGGAVGEEEWQQEGISLTIKTPVLPDKPEWGCDGGSFVLERLPPNTLISTLKDRIAARLSFPAGRQKLSVGNVVLKNQQSLASYQLVGSAEVLLGVKERGKK